MYIKVTSALSVCIAFLVTHICFITYSSIYINNYSNIQFKFCYLLFLLFLPRATVLLNRKYIFYNILVFLVVGSIMASALLNRGIFSKYINSSLLFSFCIIVIVWYLEILDYDNQMLEGFRIIFYIVLAYCILSDILIFVDPHKIYNEWGTYTVYNLLGTKFELTYLHFWCIILFSIVYQEYDERIMYGLIAWCGLIAIVSECSTMVIGTMLFALLYFLKDKIMGLLENRLFLVVCVGVFTCILLLGSSILQIPIVQNFIINVLHESPTLTGRMNIYKKIGFLLLVNPLVGGGYDNNYNFSKLFTDAANYQNGILDLMLSFGLVGVTLFFLLLLVSVTKSRKVKNSIPLLAVYVFIALSSVEIVFRRSFYILLVVLAACSWCPDFVNDSSD